MTRRERRRLARLLRHAEEQGDQKKGKKNRKIAYGGIAVLAIIVALWLLAPAQVQGTPSLVLEKVYHDFGQVSQAGGTVSADIAINNTGEGDLLVTSLSTSCMCTSASIVVGEVEGPRYGMHGIEGGGFSTPPIPPGGHGTLRIYYNPNVHKNFRGAATRIITLTTNDPAKRIAEVRADLTQVD